MGNYPDNNVVGKVKIDAHLLKQPSWEKAKREHDIDAAQKIIESIWAQEKTTNIKNITNENMVLIAQPSTSKKNIVPVVLAEMLSRETGLKYIIGDEHFDFLHNKEAKNMTRMERVFNRREYKLFDPENFKALVGNREIAIVEDVLTSGGSVAAFCNELKKHGCNVVSVVALMGDRRLNMDKKTREKLQASLDKNDLQFSANDLAQVLTRTEAGYLIMNLNNIRTEDGREKIAGKIQGLYDQGFIKGLGRNPNTRRHTSPQRHDRGHEPSIKDAPHGVVRSNPKHGPESAVERLKRKRQVEKSKGFDRDR
jgi:hypothetical protein